MKKIIYLRWRRVNHLLTLLNKQTKNYQNAPKQRTPIKTNVPSKKKGRTAFLLVCLYLETSIGTDSMLLASSMSCLPIFLSPKSERKKLNQQQKALIKSPKPLLHYGNRSSSTCLAGLGSSGLQIEWFQCFPSLHHNLATPRVRFAVSACPSTSSILLNMQLLGNSWFMVWKRMC